MRMDLPFMPVKFNEVIGPDMVQTSLQDVQARWRALMLTKHPPKNGAPCPICNRFSGSAPPPPAAQTANSLRGLLLPLAWGAHSRAQQERELHFQAHLGHFEIHAMMQNSRLRPPKPMLHRQNLLAKLVPN
mmetsp:Transcript_116667/g.206538  ORF Transcript_116667/g.206538 Transcript_116667/m.206538 type:complete len:131 (-) Transcript_116667:513-905(-)